MNFLTIIVITVFFSVAFCDRKLAKKRSKRNYENLSFECQTATEIERYNCMNNACSKWNCYSGTIISFCRKTWDEMDCIKELVARKCSLSDLKILQNQFDSDEAILLSNRCKDFTRNSPIDPNMNDQFNSFIAPTKNSPNSKFSTKLIINFSHECENRIEIEKNDCFVKACDKWKCYDGSNRNGCSAKDGINCQDLGNMCHSVWDSFDCLVNLVDQKCLGYDQQSVRDQILTIKASYESNRCQNYPSNNFNFENEPKYFVSISSTVHSHIKKTSSTKRNKTTEQNKATTRKPSAKSPRNSSYKGFLNFKMTLALVFVIFIIS